MIVGEEVTSSKKSRCSDKLSDSFMAAGSLASELPKWKLKLILLIMFLNSFAWYKIN